MKVLFDQGVPVPLRLLLTEHQVATAFKKGWHLLTDDELLARVEGAGFDPLITTDQNLRPQPVLHSLPFALLVLSTTDWRVIRDHGAETDGAIRTLTKGVCRTLTVPHGPR